MIYLDNASTSWPKPPQVVEAMRSYLEELGASPGRGGYSLAIEAERLVENTRRQLANLFDVDDANRMILCFNCTDALNMAIKGVLVEGDHVVATLLEHNSVSRPLQRLADEGFIQLSWVQPGTDGVIDPQAVERAMQPKTRLVICTHASNVLGTIQPVEQIGALVRQRQALFLVDAAQTAGVLPISAEAMGIDLLAFSGHKALLGPPGTGGLYVGPRAKVGPWREGGTGGDSATPVQPSELPFALESGTPNTVGLVGLGAALEALAPQATLEHARSLLADLIGHVQGHPAMSVVGSPQVQSRVGTLAILLDDFLPEEAAAVLDESFGICVRGGLQCAPLTHRAMGTYPDGTIRIAPGPTTTADQMATLWRALCEMTE